ncbi:hypothetical protein L1987_46877 [Smallanthus sonchifolius]|uniref:Uncharacterized protein n=1 Tax=Smallanthus sonchifolius TaxID=185202 RepID=A0ACB9G0U2_9ASTR|nr:hypothetical protein L1987_46877 [Smallanthus sonchifolius]
MRNLPSGATVFLVVVAVALEAAVVAIDGVVAAIVFSNGAQLTPLSFEHEIKPARSLRNPNSIQNPR